MNKPLQGRVVAITGASSGIGRAIAIQCAEQGASLLLIGRSVERMREAAREFPADTVCECWELDLENADTIPEIPAPVLERLGRIYGFVHCAGTAGSTPLRMLDSAEMEREYRLNVVSGIMLARVFSGKKHLSPAGGSFVFISSAAAHRGTAGKCSYSATKGALISAARSLAAELVGKKIRVNTVSPGYVMDTGITRDDYERLPEEGRKRIQQQHPLGLGRVEDVAAPVVFLLADGAQWITGADLAVDGGFSFCGV